MPTSASYRHVLMLVAATACWGCGTVLSKQVLDRGVAPLTLLVVELTASGLFLLVGAVALGAIWTRGPHLVKLAALGVLNPGLAYALGLVGLVSISASMSVLLWAVEPVLIMLLAFVVLRERIRLRAGAALAAALTGVLLVIYQPGATGDVTGIGLTVAAVTACAAYTILTRRLMLDDSSVAVVLVQQVVALGFAIAVAGATAAVGTTRIGLPADLETWALAAASGAIYYGLAFWFFIAGLRRVPAAVAGAYLPLIPVFGLTAGYLIGERLCDRQLLGAALVIAGTAGAAVHHLRHSATRRP
jgi:drug/metabolite transporter (DMT)-like permease